MPTAISEAVKQATLRYAEREWTLHTLPARWGRETVDRRDGSWLISGSQQFATLAESRDFDPNRYVVVDLEWLAFDQPEMAERGGYVGRLNEAFLGHPAGSLVIVAYGDDELDGVPTFTYLIENPSDSSVAASS